MQMQMDTDSETLKERKQTLSKYYRMKKFASIVIETLAFDYGERKAKEMVFGNAWGHLTNQHDVIGQEMLDEYSSLFSDDDDENFSIETLEKQFLQAQEDDPQSDGTAWVPKAWRPQVLHSEAEEQAWINLQDVHMKGMFDEVQRLHKAKYPKSNMSVEDAAVWIHGCVTHHVLNSKLTEASDITPFDGQDDFSY